MFRNHTCHYNAENMKSSNIQLDFIGKIKSSDISFFKSHSNRGDRSNLKSW